MNRRTIKLYFYEGVVIVASILVAFALDATWASYKDSRVEQRILGELLGEFEAAKLRIELSVAELESAISASLELAEHLATETGALPPDAAASLKPCGITRWKSLPASWTPSLTAPAPRATLVGR